MPSEDCNNRNRAEQRWIFQTTSIQQTVKEITRILNSKPFDGDSLSGLTTEQLNYQAKEMFYANNIFEDIKYALMMYLENGE